MGNDDNAQDAVDSKGTTSAFLALLLTDVPIFLVVTLLFCFLRRKYRCAVETRRQINALDSFKPPLATLALDSSLPANGAELESDEPTWFGWALRAWHMSDFEFAVHSGIDGLLLRLFVHCCLSISVCCVPFAFLIMIPVYETGRMDAKDIMSRISVANLKDDSARIVVVVLGAYYITAVAVYFLSQLYMRLSFLQRRLPVGDWAAIHLLPEVTWYNFLVNGDTTAVFDCDAQGANYHSLASSTEPPQSAAEEIDDKVKVEIVEVNADGSTEMSDIGDAVDGEQKEKDTDETKALTAITVEKTPKGKGAADISGGIPVQHGQFTLLIRDIPEDLREERKLREFIGTVVANESVFAVTLVPVLDEVLAKGKEVEKHRKAIEKLAKKEEIDENELESEECRAVLRKAHCWGLFGAKVDVLQKHKSDLKEALAEMSGDVFGNLEMGPTAFVQLASMRERALLEGSLLTRGLCAVAVDSAPNPVDVHWHNTSATVSDQQFGVILSEALMVILLLFWSIPSAGIQSLANVRQLVKRAGGDITDVFPSAFVIWLEGMLAVVLLNAWMALLPLIISQIVARERHISVSRFCVSANKKYFDCLLVMLVLVTAVAGSALKNLDRLKGGVGSVITLLGTGLSQTSVFFVTYVLHTALTSFAFGYLRVGYWIGKWLLAADSRSAESHALEVWTTLPPLMVTLVLCVTYGVMSPIIWLFAVLYFALAYVYVSHQMATTYVNAHCIGLALFPSLFSRLCLGIVLSLVTTLAVVSLKKSRFGAPLIVPLFPLLYLAWRQSHAAFKKPFEATDATAAAQMDKVRNTLRDEDAFIAPVIRKYRN